jgi:hypothetical protein
MTEMNNIKQRKLNQWKEDILEDYNKYWTLNLNNIY